MREDTEALLKSLEPAVRGRFEQFRSVLLGPASPPFTEEQAGIAELADDIIYPEEEILEVAPCPPSSTTA